MTQRRSIERKSKHINVRSYLAAFIFIFNSFVRLLPSKVIMKSFAKVLICLLLIKVVNCLQKSSIVEVISYLNHATDDSYEFL